MNTELNKAAEKYADNIISQVDFIAGIESEAAKEYWYKKFQSNQKEVSDEEIKAAAKSCEVEEQFAPKSAAFYYGFIKGFKAALKYK